MATHSSIFTWEIPWTEEPGRLQSMGLQSQTRLSDKADTHPTRSYVAIKTATEHATTLNM